MIAVKVRRFHGPEHRSVSGLGVRSFRDATHLLERSDRLIEVPCGVCLVYSMKRAKLYENLTDKKKKAKKEEKVESIHE